MTKKIKITWKLNDTGENIDQKYLMCIDNGKKYIAFLTNETHPAGVLAFAEEMINRLLSNEIKNLS